MNYRLKKHNKRLKNTINLESSKSESNRVLIINALAGGEIDDIYNLSNARDTQTMLRLLSGSHDEYDVKDAGTTMRFLTAYTAIAKKESVLTGTDRMKQRPIGPLTEALKEIGAEIEYLEKDGYPPMKIKQIQGQSSNHISIPGNISSQYISALLMIAPCLPQGLKITLSTEVYSRPYIQMTLDLMGSFGASTKWEGQEITIASQNYQPTSYTVEGDWSGASYWYGFMALAPEQSSLTLPGIWQNSKQGDNEIANIMQLLGVNTEFDETGVVLEKRSLGQKKLSLDFRSCPDLAQTVMVVAAATGVTLEMVGLESLKIKETDRIEAMQNELRKIGSDLVEEGNTWTLLPTAELPSSVAIKTYEDHRMAMAFAPLSMLMDVTIEDIDVVEKSYPGFFEEVRGLGVGITTI